MYSLILDDIPSHASRQDARVALDEALARPLDSAEAEQHDRERWGTDQEAVAAAEAKDSMWGRLTYGEAA